MKKLLLILMISCTISCGYAPMDNTDNGIVIKEIEKNGTYCNYYGVGNWNLTGTITDKYFKFRDTCGKFQIGDTVNLVKK